MYVNKKPAFLYTIFLTDITNIMNRIEVICFLLLVLYSTKFVAAESTFENRQNEYLGIDTTRIYSSCPQSDTMYIKGYFVLFSQFVNVDRKLFNLCVNGARITTVVIYALYSVIIDQSWDATGESLQIVLVAPVWEVMGPINITLDGRKGDHHVPTKAKDGSIGSGQGEDGKPGLPGGPGGYFFGVGSVFINGGNLKISANGGDGGPGQHGGNGGVGNKGETIDPLGNLAQSASDLRCETGLCNNGEGFFNNTHYKCKKSLNVRDKFPVFERTCTIKVFGKNGTVGGNGGNGGKGGLGGFSGNITIIEFDNESGIIKHNSSGLLGEIGKGGNKGRGGESGDTIWYETTTVHNPTTHYNHENKIKSRYDSGKFGESGKPGLNGSVSSVIKEPQSINVSFSKITSFVEEYVTYLEKNLNVKFDNYTFLTRFINQFYCSEKWRNSHMTYNVLGFSNEMQRVASLLFINKSHIDVVPCYKVILYNIRTFSKGTDFKKLEMPTKKVISYLHMDLLVRIYNLGDHSQSNLILYLEKHLNSTYTFFEDLNNSKNTTDPLNLVAKKILLKMSKVESDYEEDVLNILKGYQIFVDKDITSFISNIENDSSTIMETSLSIINEKQKVIIQNEQEIYKAFRDLEIILAGQSCVSTIKTVCQFIKLLLHVGEFLGKLFGRGVTTEVNLLLSKEKSMPSSVELKENITNTVFKIKSLVQQEVEHVQLLLEEVYKKTQKYQGQLNVLEKVVVDIQSKLKNITTFFEIQVLRNELEKALKSQESILSGVKQRTSIYAKKSSFTNTYFTLKNSTTKKALFKRNALTNREALQDLQTISDFVSLGVSMTKVYFKYNKNNCDIEHIIKVLKRGGKDFIILKKFEERVKEVIFSSLEKVENDLVESSKRLENMSTSALDMSKWNIPSRLKRIVSHIEVAKHSINGALNVKLLNFLQNMKGLLNNLVSVFGRINNNQEILDLSNYVKDITSDEANKIIVGDSKLKSILNQCKTSISSGLVLVEYRTVIDGFKKFVFPLASLYLKTIADPAGLLFENFDSLINKVITETNNLQIKLHEYRASLDKEDKATGVKDCAGVNDNTLPFFVWKNKDYREEISKLLSGEKVIFKADITGSERKENAIKIKSIEIKIKPHNKQLQSELDDILAAFEVDVTHLGNSFYKCDGKTYISTSHKLNGHFSFYHEDGKPVSQSVSFEQLERNYYMLSPFATWQFEIYSDEEDPFEALKPYKGQVDLELAGLEYYIKPEKANCYSLEVEKHYKTTDEYEL